MKYSRWIPFAFVVIASLTPVKTRAQGAQSRGWVGVVFTTGIGQTNSAGAITFTDYPFIESIDPGSPAERAGLQAGDMIISLNSQDLRKNPIPMSSMLVPGQKILFRYRRDGDNRSSTIQVAERPPGTMAIVNLRMIEMTPEPAQRARMEAQARARGREVVVRERSAGGLMPAVSVAPLILGPGAPTIRVAGAELTQLNEGLREALNVTGDGLFVINVALGTPAGESGLRSGDVIVRVEREKIANPGELIRMMRVASEQHLMLQVLRKRKQHTLTLRW